MRKFAIIIEKYPDGGFGAYAPDLPGCIGMGATKEETLHNWQKQFNFILMDYWKRDYPCRNQMPRPKIWCLSRLICASAPN